MQVRLHQLGNQEQRLLPAVVKIQIHYGCHHHYHYHNQHPLLLSLLSIMALLLTLQLSPNRDTQIAYTVCCGAVQAACTACG